MKLFALGLFLSTSVYAAEFNPITCTFREMSPNNWLLMMASTGLSNFEINNTSETHFLGWISWVSGQGESKRETALCAKMKGMNQKDFVQITSYVHRARYVDDVISPECEVLGQDVVEVVSESKKMTYGDSFKYRFKANIGKLRYENLIYVPTKRELKKMDIDWAYDFCEELTP